MDDAPRSTAAHCCEGLTEPRRRCATTRACRRCATASTRSRASTPHAAEPAARALPMPASRTRRGRWRALLHARERRPDRRAGRRLRLRRRRAHLLPGAHRQRRLPAHRDRAPLGARAGARHRLRAEARRRRQRLPRLHRRGRAGRARHAARWPAGSPVQSVPPQGKLPQMFETSAEIVARAEWNALRAAPVAAGRHGAASMSRRRHGRPHAQALVLLGPSGSFPPARRTCNRIWPAPSLFRLDPGLAVDATVDALEVGRVYVADADDRHRRRRPAAVRRQARQRALREARHAGGRGGRPSRRSKRVRIDLEPLARPGAAAAAAGRDLGTCRTRCKPVAELGRPQIAAVRFTGSGAHQHGRRPGWRESDLQAMIGIQGWNAPSLVKAIAAPAAERPAGRARGRRVRLRRQARLLRQQRAEVEDPAAGYRATPTATPTRPVGTPATTGTTALAAAHDLDGFAGTADRAARLPRPRGARRHARRAGPCSMRPTARRRPTASFDAREASRADFGLSGRAMAAHARRRRAARSPTPTPRPKFPFRSTHRPRGEPPARLGRPADRRADRGRRHRDRARPHGARSGRRPADRADRRARRPAGVDAAEIAVLADIVHADGRSTLVLQHGPRLFVPAQQPEDQRQRRRTRPTARRVAEVLGNGDASLAQPALHPEEAADHLRLGADAERRARARSRCASTACAGTRWPRSTAPRPTQPVYATRIDDDAPHAADLRRRRAGRAAADRHASTSRHATAAASGRTARSRPAR